MEALKISVGARSNNPRVLLRFDCIAAVKDMVYKVVDRLFVEDRLSVGSKLAWTPFGELLLVLPHSLDVDDMIKLLEESCIKAGVSATRRDMSEGDYSSLSTHVVGLMMQRQRHRYRLS
ncbi:MAG TPA: hypothetical protein VFZ48_02495 [Candidatus Saccharimonadales bacterium]